MIKSIHILGWVVILCGVLGFDGSQVATAANGILRDSAQAKFALLKNQQHIPLGFHRLASHRSFKVPKWLEYFFILCGTLACQGGVKGWVGYHRMHHLYADRPGDPHDSTRGFWWSHIS